jgi:hypothetical protein
MRMINKFEVGQLYQLALDDLRNDKKAVEARRKHSEEGEYKGVRYEVIVTVTRVEGVL